MERPLFAKSPWRHYSARPIRFGSRGPSQVLREFISRPFVSDTSPKCIDREGLGRCRTGTRQYLMVALTVDGYFLELLTVDGY